MQIAIHREPGVTNLNSTYALKAYKLITVPLKALVSLANFRMREELGVEVDLLLSGSYGMKCGLSKLELVEIANQVNFNDIGIFVSIRVVDQLKVDRILRRPYSSSPRESRLSREEFRNLRLTRQVAQYLNGSLRALMNQDSFLNTSMFGTRHGAGEYPTTALASTYRFQTQIASDCQLEFNIIYRFDLVSDNLISNMESLFRSFDMDCCKSAHVISSTGEDMTERSFLAFSDSFKEAMTTGMINTTGEVIPQRREKYQNYLRGLPNLTFDWELS